MARQGPTVRSRRIGAELRRYREAAGYTMEQIADEVGVDQPRMSRIETGRGRVRVSEARVMLALYDVTGDDAEQLMTLVREVRQPGWWEQHDGLPDRYTTYIGLETEASALRTYEPIVIPGLLQTEDYARAALHTDLPGIGDDEELEARVQVRMTRQDVLTRDPTPLDLLAIIDESAIRRIVGGPEVMAGQMAALRQAVQRPNIRIQVLPYTAGTPASQTGPVVLIRFPDEADADVGYVENWVGDLYLERPKQVARCARMIEDLCAAALSPRESVQFMASIRYT